MTKKNRVQIVENAINEYLDAKRSGDADAIKTAINGMENVYHSFACILRKLYFDKSL